MAGRLNLGDIMVRLGLDTAQFSRELRQAQRSVAGFGAGARQAGLGVTAAVTAPLVGAAAAALKFAGDFDSAMTQSTAIMAEFSNASELTAGQQAQLRDEMETTARSLAKDLNIEANKTAEAFFFLASAGLNAEQSIKALPQVAAFAKAGMFDLATATTLAADAQAALGLKTKDPIQNLANLTRVTDVLVKANTLANATVEQFSTALTTKAGAALKIANKDIEEGVAVLAAFADQGIKAQNAGVALNIVLRELSTKGIKNAEAFKSLGIEVFNSQNNFNNMADIIGDLEDALEGMSDAQKKATLLQLGFTDKSVIFIQSLIGQSEKIAEFEEKLNKAGGTAQEVAEKQLEAFTEQLGLVEKRVTDAAIELGLALFPALLDIIDAAEPLIDLLEFVINLFAAMPKPIQMIVVGALALVAAIGPLVIIIGFLAQSIAAVMAIWPSVLAAFAAAKAAVVSFGASLGALGPVFAVVAVAVGAFVLTDMIMEATGARKALDDLLDSMLNIQRNAEGMAIPSFLSEEDLRMIELAEEKTGKVFSRTAEGWKQAQAALHEYNMNLREFGEETAEAAAKGEIQISAVDRFAASLGVTSTEVERVAARLGMTTEELILSKTAFETASKEIERYRNELDGLVNTTPELQAEVNKLSLAIQQEGGITQLTTAEIMRLGDIFLAAADNGAVLTQTATEIVIKQAEIKDATERANEALKMQEAIYLTASGHAMKLAQDAELLTKQIESVGGATELSRVALEQAAAQFEAIAKAGGELTKTQQEVVDLNKQLTESEKAAADAAKLQADAQDALNAKLEEFGAAAGIVTAKATAEFDLFTAAITGTLEKTGGVIEKEFRDKIIKAAEDLKKKFPGLADEIDKFLSGVEPGLESATSKTVDWGEQVKELAATFEILGISADSALGSIMGGLTAAGNFGTNIKSSFDELSGLSDITSKQGLEAGLALGQNVVGGAAAIWQATSADGAAAVFGGAAAGMQMGAQIGGPIGAGIGAAVGAAIGGIRALWKSESEKIQADIERDFGVKISEELAKAIEATADELDLGRFEARLLHLGDIISEAGGAGAFGFEQTETAVIDLLNSIELGAIPAAEGIQEVGEVFGMLADEAVEAGKIADASLLNIINRARELGQEVPEIAAFVAEQLGEAMAGLELVIGTKIEGGEGEEAMFGGIQVFTPEQAQQQADLFAATFFAVLEEQGLKAAVDALGPAFEAMQEKLAAFGDVDFGGVGRFFELARDPQFGPLLEGVEGLNQLMTGLANAGYLTADSFNAIQGQGLAAFEQLTAAGLTEQEALQQMAPLLQNIIDASQKFGFEIDADTQKLIDQAEAAGIAFSTDPMQRMVDVLEVIAQKLGATAEELGIVEESATSAADNGSAAMDDLASSGEEAGERMTERFDTLAMDVNEDFLTMQEGALTSFSEIEGASEATINQVRAVGDAAAGSASGFDKMASAARRAASAASDAASAGENGGRDAREMQEGGLVTRPTFTLLGERGPELVLPLHDIRSTSAGGPELLEGLNMGGGSGGTRVIQLVLDRRVLFEVIEDGQRQGELRTHERSLQRFGD